MTGSRFLLRCIAALASIAVLAAPSHAQQKTVKACDAEWRANKAAIQGAHKTKKAFMAECRAGTGQTAAAPQQAPEQAPAASNQTNAQPQANAGANAQPPANPPEAQPRRTARQTPLERPRRGTTIATGAGEFATETEANAHCPGETVVWANTRSKIYHFAGSRSYGRTKIGAYMCEKDTSSAGFRSAKNEKRPR
jgi:hypothetical protein